MEETEARHSRLVNVSPTHKDVLILILRTCEHVTFVDGTKTSSLRLPGILLGAGLVYVHWSLKQKTFLTTGLVTTEEVADRHNIAGFEDGARVHRRGVWVAFRR